MAYKLAKASFKPRHHHLKRKHSAMNLPALKNIHRAHDIDARDSSTTCPPITAAGVLELVESYTIEASGLPLTIYKTAALAAGDWVQIDDIELSVDESLSGDEVAQCIFAICGGDLLEANGIGETSRHWIYYSPDMRGLLGLSPKLTATS